MGMKVKSPAREDKFIALPSSQASTSTGPVSLSKGDSVFFLLGLGSSFDCQKETSPCFLIPGTEVSKPTVAHSDVHWENLPESQHLWGDLLPLFGNHGVVSCISNPSSAE